MGQSLLDNTFSPLPGGREGVPRGWQCPAVCCCKSRSQCSLHNLTFSYDSAILTVAYVLLTVEILVLNMRTYSPSHLGSYAIN